mgnify:FL=1
MQKLTPTIHRMTFRQLITRDWRLYLMLVLPVAYYLIFCYKPMIGVIIAFQKYNLFRGIAGSPWVGLDNFKFVLNKAIIV